MCNISIARYRGSFTMFWTQIVRLVLVLLIFCHVCSCIPLPEADAKAADMNGTTEPWSNDSGTRTMLSILINSSMQENEKCRSIVAHIELHDTLGTKVENYMQHNSSEGNITIKHDIQTNDDIQIQNEELDKLRSQSDKLNTEYEQLKGDNSNMKNETMGLKTKILQLAEKHIIETDKLKDKIMQVQEEHYDTIMKLESEVIYIQGNISNIKIKMNNMVQKYEKLEEQVGKQNKQLRDIELSFTKFQENQKVEIPSVNTLVINGLHEQMMEDIKSEYWLKSVDLMKKHLNKNTEAYKELNSITDYDNYPLLVAEKGYLELLQLMLNNELPINMGYTSDKRTILHYAAGFGHYDMVKFLIEEGADVCVKSSYGGTPLHYAASTGHVNIMQLLVESGADINATDKMRGGTPRDWAISNGHKAAAEWLTDKKNNTTIIINNNDETATTYSK